MTKELQFIEQINTLAHIGKDKGNVLTREEVISALPDFQLNEEQWRLMGEFLFSRQVRLEGYEPEVREKVNTHEFSVDEKNFITHYEKDMAAMPKMSVTAIEESLQDYKVSGVQPADLYNGLLPHVYKESLKHACKTEQIGDIVQEANLHTFLVLENVDGIPESNAYTYIIDEVKIHLAAFLEEGEEAGRETKKIIDKLNQLVEAVEVLKEQGALYTMDDISEFLDIPVEEIEELLRIAGEWE